MLLSFERPARALTPVPRRLAPRASPPPWPPRRFLAELLDLGDERDLGELVLDADPVDLGFADPGDGLAQDDAAGGESTVRLRESEGDGPAESSEGCADPGIEERLSMPVLVLIPCLWIAVWYRSSLRPSSSTMKDSVLPAKFASSQ